MEPFGVDRVGGVEGLLALMLDHDVIDQLDGELSVLDAPAQLVAEEDFEHNVGVVPDPLAGPRIFVMSHYHIRPRAVATSSGMVRGG